MLGKPIRTGGTCRERVTGNSWCRSFINLKEEAMDKSAQMGDSGEGVGIPPWK